MSGPELYAVTGRPVGHSLSPALFELFFRAFERKAIYTRLAADSAREALETARAIGLRGLNVTSPFKEEVISLLDDINEEAVKIGAVNCLKLDGPVWASGYNTDFIGLIGTLRNSGLSPEGRRALVLGTGGAARAAAFGLLRAGAEKVILAGRSVERTQAAALSLGGEAARLEDVGKILHQVDIVVSCLPFPASRILPNPPASGVPVIDAHYSRSGASPGEGNRRLTTALSWLFHQAIPSFEIFTGLKVSEDVRQKTGNAFAHREARRKPHVALVGFMGTGKTATAGELARLMGREFIDTDEFVEAKAGMSVPAIFRRRGEGVFRSFEKEALRSILEAAGKPSVISVGGGAVLDKDNRRALTGSCRIVWLWASARAAVSRLDVSTRPVLDPGRPLESAERTLLARIPLYASVADIIVNAEGRSPLGVARRIKDEMG